MNSFNTQLHSDDFAPYQPTEADYAEYAAYLDGELDAAREEANLELQQIAAEDSYEEWECEECGDLVPDGMECECEYAYEYDGQPDEAQEWYDFDPDC